MDPYIKGTYNLGISRLYDCLGMDKLGYVARPGCAPIEEQISKIPPGDYVLYDDDVATGGTMAWATNELSKYGIRITERKSYIQSNGAEVLDARDFVPNSEHGGLVMKDLNGSYSRQPYVLPFVNPAVRASIPSLNTIFFS